MKNVYICNTYYHLLISIIKSLNEENIKNDLILSSEGNNKSLINDKRIIKKLNDSRIFDNIIFFDYSSEQLKLEKERGKNILEPIKKYFFLNKVTNNLKIDFKNYIDIYIFNDTCLIGRIINKKKYNYILLEDGKDCFKNNESRIKEKKSLRKIIKRVFLGMKDMGESKYIKYIEVNDSKNIYISKTKILENNKEKMFEKLTSQQKKIIWNIFIDKINLNNLDNLILLITQPLSEDGLVATESKKIEIYRKIIETIKNSGEIIIKTHPREKTNYSKYFKNITIIDDPFPIEIFNFSEKIKIKKAITISSTSITSIKNCESIEILGWNWLYCNNK